MKRIKKALPLALILFTLCTLLALGVSADDCIHPPEYWSYTDTPYDCTSNYRVYTCSLCGFSWDDQIIGFDNHSYVGTVTQEPTCTEGGTMSYTCSQCGDSYTGKLEPTGHDYQEDYHAPTCGESGWINGKCSCGATSYEEDYYIYLPATGRHVYKDGVCTECGASSADNCSHNYTYVRDSAETHILTCSKCGITQGDAQEHTWSNRTQTGEGSDEYHYIFEYTCSICKATKTQEESIACTDSHNWMYMPVDENFHRQECMTCATTGETALHRWDNGVVDQEATLGTEGYYRYTCLDCNAIKETITPAITIEDILNRCTKEEAVELFDALYEKYSSYLADNSTILYQYRLMELKTFVEKIFVDINENGYSSPYWSEYGHYYQLLYDGLVENDIAYEMGYNDAISAVVDKNPVQGLFQGMFAGLTLFYQTVAGGVALGGISLNNVISTFALIVIGWLLLKLVKK